MRCLSFSLWTRLRRCTSGIAATEFAVLLPVLVVMFFGLVEASDAMTANRKVAISANTLADLAAQSEQLYEADLDDLFDGVKAIIEPNDSSGMQLTLVSVILDEDDNPIVHWSRDSTGATPYTAGNNYTKLSDDDVVSSLGSLIVVEMTYVYNPGLTSHVLETPITFNRQSIRWPRLSNRVQLCDASDNCTS